MNTRELRDAIKQMDYEDFLEFEAVLKSHRKSFKPFRIKTKFKRCGKAECTCMDGPANNEWGNLHGPFLSVQYQDKASKKTRVHGLGRFYEDYEIKELANVDYPNWYDFKISKSFYEMMSDDVKRQCKTRALTDWEFEAMHGVGPDDDMDGHPRRLIFNRAKFTEAETEANRVNNIYLSRWSEYGVGTTYGIDILDGLIDDGYYFKE